VDYELRDPIHKRIAFSEFERSVIDHPFFQRLRFISQLGFLQAYVYPGAVHNRFAHCIGAMHVAGRLFGRVISSSTLLTQKLTKKEIEALRQRVRIAGLLHDVGHGPFSHASEAVFPRLKELPLNWDWWSKKEKRQAVHEDYSVLLVQTLSEEGVFSPEFAQDVSSLIHASVHPSPWLETVSKRAPGLRSLLKGLVSGEVDCDRMDYLLRDSYFCGVVYGEYDIDWLISSMHVEEQEGKLVFGISENGVRAFEDLLLARYHMIDQVYFHKTKAGFTHHLEQAVLQKEIDLQIPTDPYAYVELRDGAVIEMMFEAAKDKRNYWSHNLMNRITARRVLRLQDTQDGRRTLKELKGMCDEAGIKWFTHAAANELTRLNSVSRKDNIIFVRKKVIGGYELVPISKYSDLLQKYNEKLRFTDFFVHAEDRKRFEKLEASID